MSSPGRKGGEEGGGEPVSELWTRADDTPSTSSRTSELLLDPAVGYSVQTSCILSRSDLKLLPLTVLNNNSLKHLYLEGNHLTSVPGSMFISLPNLLWLDLRNNQIASLPAEIGSHRCLRTLLLEGNPISELPPELGNVISLKGLNLRNCPIRFPPPDILHQGYLVILQYLRSVLAQRPVSVRKDPPGALCHKAQSGGKHCGGEERKDDRPQERLLLHIEQTHSPQSQRSLAYLQGVPAMEKLQLSELSESSIEEQNEPEDEDELQRFEELKEKLILLDRAELGARGPSRRKPLLSVDKRQPLKKEEREKQAALEQRKKSKEALQKWQTQARLIRERKMSELKQKERKKQRKREEEDFKSGLEDGSSSHLTFPTAAEDDELDRSARELELEIQELVERMKGSRWNPVCTATEQKAAVEDEQREIKTPQDGVRVRKRNVGKDLGSIFTIYTANTWPSFLDK